MLETLKLQHTQVRIYNPLSKACFSCRFCCVGDWHHYRTSCGNYLTPVSSLWLKSFWCCCLNIPKVFLHISLSLLLLPGLSYWPHSCTVTAIVPYWSLNISSCFCCVWSPMLHSELYFKNTNLTIILCKTVLRLPIALRISIKNINMAFRLYMSVSSWASSIIHLPFDHNCFHLVPEMAHAPSFLRTFLLIAPVPLSTPPHTTSLESLQLVLQIFAHQVHFLNLLSRHWMKVIVIFEWLEKVPILVRLRINIMQQQITSNLSGLKNKSVSLLHATFSVQTTRGSSAFHSYLRIQADGSSIDICSMIPLSERRECKGVCHDS